MRMDFGCGGACVFGDFGFAYANQNGPEDKGWRW
jgi:hypothetical protein